MRNQRSTFKVVLAYDVVGPKESRIAFGCYGTKIIFTETLNNEDLYMNKFY